MSKLLLINTPQYDYVYGTFGKGEENYNQEQAQIVISNIYDKVLCDYVFMRDVEVIGVVVDFFPISNRVFLDEEQKPHCLSFSQGSSIVEKIADNLHFQQTCALKKLPKNDTQTYERSVLDNFDSAKFIIDLLDPKNPIEIDSVYICGISYDNSVYETIRLLNEFYPSRNIHIISDLIWSNKPNELHQITELAQINDIQQHNFCN